MSSLFDRLRERKLFQWTVAYMASAWVLLQVLDFAADNFEWPVAVVRGATILFAFGLPIVLVLAWYQSAQHTRVRNRVIAALALVLLLTMGGWYAWWRATPSSAALPDGDFARQNIAVMYFEDRSPGKDLLYLSDALTEGLIDQLSAVPQLHVISRNGVAPFRALTIAPDSIARALKVGTLVSGSILPTSGGQLRVDVDLIDAGSGRQIDRTRIEVLQQNAIELQDSIARVVSMFLRERIGQDIRELVNRSGTRNPAAWTAFQQSRQAAAAVDALVKARDVSAALLRIAAVDSLYAQAQTYDPGWPMPTIERGWLAYRAARLLPATDPRMPAQTAVGLVHATTVLGRHPGNTDALELRGTLRYWQWLNNLATDAPAAEALLNSAEADLIASTADSLPRASALNVLSHLRINKGQLSQAKLDAETAYNTDPYLADVDRTILRAFLASLDLGMRDEAQRWCDIGQMRFPQSYRFVECRLWLYTLPAVTKPDPAAIWKTYEEYVNASPANVLEFDKLKGKMMVAIGLLRAGLADSARALARSAQGSPEIDPRGELTSLAAIVHAQAGDTDEALELTARYLAANPHLRALAANDRSWWLAELRRDPRYQALVRVR